MRRKFFERNLMLLLCFLLACGCAATEKSTKPATTIPAPKPVIVPVILYVAADQVNLRECPSVTCKVVAGLKLDDEVIKLGQKENWINVRVKATGREGWVASSLVGKTAKKKPSSRIKEQSSPRGKEKPGDSELQEEFAP